MSLIFFIFHIPVRFIVVLMYFGLWKLGTLQFYFPNGLPASKEVAAECLARINQIFAAHPDGLPLSGN